MQSKDISKIFLSVKKLVVKITKSDWVIYVVLTIIWITIKKRLILCCKNLIYVVLS